MIEMEPRDYTCPDFRVGARLVQKERIKNELATELTPACRQAGKTQKGHFRLVISVAEKIVQSCENLCWLEKRKGFL